MNYVLRPGHDLSREFRRVCMEQLTKALHDTASMRDPDGLHAGVHRARQGCKRLRAALKLARRGLPRSVYAREARALRKVQRRLSAVRDSAARVEALEALMRESSSGRAEKACRHALKSARLERDRWQKKRRLERRLENVRRGLQRIRRRVRDWDPQLRTVADLHPGLLGSYRSGRRAMKHAMKRGRSEDFHEWRKRVKEHSNHLRLLREVVPAACRERVADVQRLGELLGDDHDLAVLRLELGDRAMRGSLARELTARRTRLRREAADLGRQLYCDRPRSLEHLLFDTAEGR